MTKFKNSPTVRAIEKSIAEQQERQERIRQSKLRCEAWNAANRVGVKVLFLGKHWHTTQPASVDLSGYASVHLGGRWSAVDLDSVEVAK